MMRRMDKDSMIKFVEKRCFWLNNWERDFIMSCKRRRMTERMENILKKIYEKVKDISDDEIRRQIFAQIKLEFVVTWGEHKIWYEVYEIIHDIWAKRQERPLTDKQIKLINKYWRVLARKLPDKWGVSIRGDTFIYKLLTIMRE